MGKQFRMKDELVAYCDSDVDILKTSMMRFHALFKEVTSQNPFAHSITLPSACNRYFRTRFLESHTLALIPHGGYSTKTRYSNKAIKWLKWVAHKEGRRIEHAKNGGEHRVGGFL